MPRHSGPHRKTPRRPACGRTLAVVLVLAFAAPAAHAGSVDALDPPAPSVSASPADLAGLGWIWPADSFRLARPYVAPAHEYGPGHRGIDLELLGEQVVDAPQDGVVAFAGSVAGRGILTIDHGAGLVTTLEPVLTELAPGTTVQRGEGVAALSIGGHVSAGRLHFGVRLNGAYINPQLLLGGTPRAVLLPCCP